MRAVLKFDDTQQLTEEEAAIVSGFGWEYDHETKTLHRRKPVAPDSVSHRRTLVLDGVCYVLFADHPIDFTHRYAAEVVVMNHDDYAQYERGECFRQQLAESLKL